jgi:hypothetical protein
MTDALAREVAKLQLQVQTLQEQLRDRPATTQTALTKDLSLVPLVPKWAGTSKSTLVKEFFDTVDSVGNIGKWSGEDKIRITTLKLVDTAKAFYNATPELHVADLTWPRYKEIFLARFKDSRDEQFHHAQLHNARQSKHETVLEFADRCKALAKNVVPQVNDPAIQKLLDDQAEHGLVTAFGRGLLGRPGRHVGYATPTTLEAAIKIAVSSFVPSSVSVPFRLVPCNPYSCGNFSFSICPANLFTASPCDLFELVPTETRTHYPRSRGPNRAAQRSTAEATEEGSPRREQ